MRCRQRLLLLLLVLHLTLQGIVTASFVVAIRARIVCRTKRRVENKNVRPTESISAYLRAESNSRDTETAMVAMVVAMIVHDCCYGWSSLADQKADVVVVVVMMMVAVVADECRCKLTVAVVVAFDVEKSRRSQMSVLHLQSE